MLFGANGRVKWILFCLLIRFCTRNCLHFMRFPSRNLAAIAKNPNLCKNACGHFSTVNIGCNHTVAANDATLFRDRFSIAPMMDYTDRYQRKFHRLLSRHTVLYTEMVTSYALHHGPDYLRFLEADLLDEEPVVLQLGGSNPETMKIAVKKAVSYGYKDINLNVGCPSERVSDKGCFGAALMLQPQLVGDLCLRMREEMPSGHLPTVKCRIGVDDADSYEQLSQFVDTVSSIAGVEHFIVHARKAVLGGKFTPAQNRMIPPLKYDVVYRLKQDFPHLKITINGGIVTLNDTLQHLADGKVDGVMVGRAAVSHPWQWRTIDTSIYGYSKDPQLTRRSILSQYGQYLDDQLKTLATSDKTTRNFLRRAGIKPVYNLFHGESNGKLFRQKINDLVNLATRTEGISLSEVLLKASEVISDEVLDLWE